MLMDTIVEKSNYVEGFEKHLNIVKFVVELTGPKMITNFLSNNITKFNSYDLMLVGDAAIFFGYPFTKNTFSYNDWKDGTNWALWSFTETPTGSVLTTVSIFLIVLLIVFIVVLIGIALHRCNYHYQKNIIIGRKKFKIHRV